MLKQWSSLFAAIILGCFFAFLATMPPAPRGIDTPDTQFSSARAMEDVRIIAAEPHPTGTPENAKIRDYLKNRMTDLGMEVSINESKLGANSLKRYNRWSGEAKTEQSLFNVIGILPGKDRTKPAVLLMAHHDTVWDSPGAADDTIGIASIFEIIRALKEGGERQRDVIVLITDAEELGLNGAINFFKDNPLREQIGAIVNFEARGGGGKSNMFQTSAGNGDLARVYGRSVKDPSASSLSAYVYEKLPNDTDLTPALGKGYIAYNISIIGRAGYYHSPKIGPDQLEEGSLQHMGSQGLDLTRALVTGDELPVQSANAVFFDVFGLFTIIYAPWWGWIFLLGGTTAYLASIRGHFKRKAFLSGAIKMAGFLLIGALLLYGLNILSGAGKGSNYYDRLAAIPRLEWIALFTCLGIFFAVFKPGRNGPSEYFGTATPILAIGIAGQFFAPTATYFISLPILLGGIAAMATQRWPAALPSTIIRAVIGAIGLGYMLFLGHLLMLGVGADMMSVAILPAALAILLLWPVLPQELPKRFKWMALLFLLLAIAIALWVRFDPMAATVPTYQVW